MVNASQETYRYGPVCNGQVRKSSTMESRSLAISETCDFERLLIPNDATRSFILRVETPLRWQVASERGQGPFGAGAPFQQPVREEGTGA